MVKALLRGAVALCAVALFQAARADGFAPSSSSSSSQPAHALQFASSVTIDHQFNQIAKVTFADGSTSSLGDALVGVNAGVTGPLTPDGKLELQVLAGFLFGRVGASNGDATFYEFPIEVTAQVNLLDRLRVGVGPVLHLAPVMKGSGFASGSDVTFDTTIGAVGRVEYRFTEKFGLGMHVNWLRLSANGASIDASRIGGECGFYF